MKNYLVTSLHRFENWEHAGDYNQYEEMEKFHIKSFKKFLHKFPPF